MADCRPDLKQREETSRMEQFPIIVENASVSINSPIELDLNKLERVEHGIKVRNIGRVDRKRLKELKATLSVASDGGNSESENQGGNEEPTLNTNELTEESQ